MKKLYFSLSAITLGLFFSLVILSSGAQAQTQETFPNSFNTGFLTGSLSPNTFTGNLGTWTAFSSGSRATIVVNNAHPRNGLTPGAYALKIFNPQNNLSSTAIDRATSPSVNLSIYAGNPNAPLLEFWIYPFEVYNGVTCATFTVEFSSDGGTNWASVYSKTSSDIRNQFTYNSYSGNNITIPIANSYRTANFKFRFIGRMSGNCGSAGQDMYLYIDDIRFIAPSGGSLPVNLIGFNAARNGGNVSLNWKVTGETNFKHYVIERSTDGNLFFAIGAVNGTNIVAVEKQYSFNDDVTAVNSKAAYYRLRLIDADGTEKLSNILNIRLSNGGGKQISLYPSPAQVQFSVKIEVAADQLATVKIINADGKVVRQMQQRLNKGNNAFTVSDIADLRTGIYSVQVIADGEMQTSKLYITK